MKQLLTIVGLAITALFNYKKQVSDLKESNARYQADNAQLHEQLEAAADGQAEVETLKAQAAEAKAKLDVAQARNTELEAQELDATNAATALANALNEHDNTPSVTPETFAVTEPGDPLEDAA